MLLLKSGRHWHEALFPHEHPPAGCSSVAAAPLDRTVHASSLQVPPGWCLVFLLPARPLWTSELVTPDKSYSCAGICICTSKRHINLNVCYVHPPLFFKIKEQRRGDSLPKTKALIAAHLEFGPKPHWLQGPGVCSAVLPHLPMSHISVSPQIGRIIHAIWVRRLH